MAAFIQGPDAAGPEWEASIAALEALGEEAWVALLTTAWGAREVQVGRARAGMPYLDAARVLAQSLGNRFLVTLIEGWQAAGYGMLGDHNRALTLAQTTLAYQREVHDPDTGSFMNFIIGDAYYHRGELDAAERHARESAEMGERHNIRPHAALGQSLLGRICMDRDEPHLTRQHYQRALDLSAGDHMFASFVARHSSGLVAALSGSASSDEAGRVLERGLQRARPAAVLRPGSAADPGRRHRGGRRQGSRAQRTASTRRSPSRTTSAHGRSQPPRSSTWPRSPFGRRATSRPYGSSRAPRPCEATSGQPRGMTGSRPGWPA